MDNGFLALKEAVEYLNVSKAEIENLVKSRKLTAYKFGGSYLRFRKDQLLLVKHELQERPREAISSSGKSVRQFWIFNGFYIVTGILLSGLLFYFLRT